MRIANIVFSFRTGGIENLLVDLLNNWPQTDEVMLCIINNVKDDDLIARIRCRSNIKVVCFGREPGSGFFETAKKMNRVLSEFRPDVIHCHSSSAFKFSLFYKLLHPACKYYLTMHSTATYRQLSSADCLLHRIFAAGVIAISAAVEQDILARKIPAEKIRRIYNGIDFKRFQSDGRSVQQKQRLVCVGRLKPEEKGQDLLLRAFAEVLKAHPDATCTFVGEAPAEHQEKLPELMALAEELGISHAVSFLGARNDVPEILAASDIFVMPSRKEGFGISLVEAMAAKVITVSPDIEGPGEIIQGKYGYTFQAGSWESLAEAIDLCLNDKNDMTQDAYAYALERFSITGMITALKDVYTGKRSDDFS